MAKAKAFTNIALIKYWGKKNILWNLPTTSSIGLTLDAFFTETEVKIDSDLKEDFFLFEGKQRQNKKVSKVMDHLRKISGNNNFAVIKSRNTVPFSNGFASSSSAFAALTRAGAHAYGLNLNDQELSTIARLGSGSASRSIFGGFSIWHAGSDHQSSFAESFLDPVDFDIRVVDIISDNEIKKISSSTGMQLAQSSPDYPKWVSDSKQQFDEMKIAIQKKDLESIGRIAEKNSLAMHELNRNCVKPFDYFTDQTREIINFIQNMRKKSFLIYATIDAGPNVKALTNNDTALKLKKELEKFGRVIISKPGSGVIDE
ncbi:diphosphomevalonate decarboxylase [Oenococcus alcoholitolerans]|uniref:diphosphomevalonate decarboxylase n=1 Tax=Oenococcus alcoholitolerans TaxID=931074 RepID=UPI003F6EA3B9